MGSARMGRRRAGVRHGFATVGLAVALALTGCGYDPSTAGNQEPPQGSAPSVDDADVSRQYAAHLVADAEQLLPVTEHIQEDGAVSGPAKAVGLHFQDAAQLSGDPDVAEVAGESVERLETLAEKLEQLPRN